MYAPTIEDIIKPYQQYPKTIQLAILLVDTNPRFLGLTRSMKAVLKALLTRACKNNGATPIKARLDIVAMQADVSAKTVQRTIATLRSAGWLKQVSDGRSAWGLFTYRCYRFSADLCAIVGLPTREKTAPVSDGETKMSDGAVYVDLTFRKDQQEILFQNRIQNPEANPITLPPELQPIIELGVKDTGVCKLRGMAHAKGHKLSDIYLVAKKRLTELKASGNRVYRYLAAMIANPKATDYTTRARQAERNSIDTEAVEQIRDRRALYANKRFAAGPGKIVKIFDGIAEVSQDGAWAYNIAGRDMNAVYDAVEKGTLRAITG
ncbi:MAG: hypothetical protein ABIO19_03760 [Burkholderiaceae bacterium]